MRNNQFTVVQSLIKDTNRIALERLRIQEEPQLSVWIDKKGNADFVFLK